VELKPEGRNKKNNVEIMSLEVATQQKGRQKRENRSGGHCKSEGKKGTTLLKEETILNRERNVKGGGGG